MPINCGRLTQRLEDGTVGLQITAGGTIVIANPSFSFGWLSGFWLKIRTESNPTWNEDDEEEEGKGIGVTDNAYLDVWVPLADLAAGIHGLLVSQKAVQPDTLTSNPDVLKDFYCLWQKGGYGFSPTERSEWVTKSGNSYGSTPWPWSAITGQETWKGPIPAGTIANAHTHPDRSNRTSRNDPRPSTLGGVTGRGDQGSADVTNLPFYVVTANAIWKAVPHAKDSIQVADRDWWKPFEKAKVKCPK